VPEAGHDAVRGVGERAVEVEDHQLGGGRRRCAPRSGGRWGYLPLAGESRPMRISCRDRACHVPIVQDGPGCR
jgi:hypothetical protein